MFVQQKAIDVPSVHSTAFYQTKQYSILNQYILLVFIFYFLSKEGLTDLSFSFQLHCNQGRIKAGADGAAAPGPHLNIGPPLH